MSIKNQPLVTVYIPTYNRVDLLKRAVKSVQEQTYQNLEIIIVDDCSTDGTHAYLEQLVKEDKRVCYFLKETNSGACVSRNIAIENAHGEFITGLDDDDYFYLNRIQVFIEHWSDEYRCIFSNIMVKKSEKLQRSNYRLAMNDEVSQKDLIKVNHIGNQIFTKTQYFREIQGFDPQMEVWQDLECWYRLLGKDGKAQRVRKNLYLMDISHPHERISKKKGKKVLNSFNHFSHKHELNEREKLHLSTHMTNYKSLDLSLKVYWVKFLNYKTLGNLRVLVKKFFKNH